MIGEVDSAELRPGVNRVQQGKGAALLPHETGGEDVTARQLSPRGYCQGSSEAESA